MTNGALYLELQRPIAECIERFPYDAEALYNALEVAVNAMESNPSLQKAKQKAKMPAALAVTGGRRAARVAGENEVCLQFRESGKCKNPQACKGIHDKAAYKDEVCPNAVHAKYPGMCPCKVPRAVHTSMGSSQGATCTL